VSTRWMDDRRRKISRARLVGVQLPPALFEIVGAEGTLEMAKVLLDALAEEEEGRLERKLRKFVDDLLLLLDLDLQEAPPELGRTDGCSQYLDSRGPDVVKGGGDGLEVLRRRGEEDSARKSWTMLMVLGHWRGWQCRRGRKG
jgi:hypothetical protein